jgi:hypothetical protein
MRKISVAAAAFVALAAFSAPATAATIISVNSGNDLDEVIHGNSGGTVTGTSLTLDSHMSDFLIQYQSSDVLKVTGNGVAQVLGNSGGFSDLAITPLANITFTKFKFNLDIPSPQDVPNHYSTDFTFDAQLFFTGGGSQTFSDVDLGSGNGNNRFVITAGLNEFIDKIVLSNLVGTSTRTGYNTIIQDYDFNAIKQASFEFASGVPEPATWAEFILGFGLVGVMLRRRRQSAVPATA